MRLDLSFSFGRLQRRQSLGHLEVTHQHLIPLQSRRLRIRWEEMMRLMAIAGGRERRAVVAQI